ncbi:putative permease YjgP/YjgQ family protein [Gimesia panareensis]|uniref:Putative permease YjgP/YjgQ family protein n=1 Tax=Gimesia panareensis TaxID=2527978 RepID=A0A518FTT9_9PLAN|nr:LptF/LptG family permease [Gimesia panareensis]QDV19705.1 putative permease YjgP/YjgQ family protein [Gimesia panareensis]
MLTTFDRYLLKRYFHVFFIGFIATYGLYVVFDGFTNIDEFQAGLKEGDSSGSLLWLMSKFYLYQSSIFFDMVSPILTVLAAVVVFSLLVRHGELNPVLSAGIPTYRLAIPLTVATVIVNCVIVANQELIIPRIADKVQAERGNMDTSSQFVEPVYDFSTRIMINGQELYLTEKRMLNAEFVLSKPTVHDFVTVKAENAFYLTETETRPGGWILKNATPKYDDLEIAEFARKMILPGKEPNDIFIVTDVGCDQLCNRNFSSMVSTPELIARINNPSFSDLSIRKQTLDLHSRLTRPFMNLIAVLMAIPFVLRKESRSQILNIAICSCVMGVIFAISQFFMYLGSASLLKPDQAAWFPVITNGTLAAWFSNRVQT